ncbi:hypothetical protein C2S52_002305 [Perilla frutescens var. hirtella]|nr:hypothetical protein C2S52_002305 [Perilla frutescens var. hirtella]
MAGSTVSLKLLIDTSAKRVLFAEASKDCVDFLFNILSSPISTLIRLVGADEMEGSLPNLYQSLDDLNDAYIQPDQNKDTILKPVAPVSSSSFPLPDLGGVIERKFYRCDQCFDRVSDDPRAVCPGSLQKMTTPVTYVAPPPAVHAAAEGGGIVKGVVTYVVMDDLVVMPMSTISSITLLDKFDVKDVGVLEEKVVALGMNEAIKLLKSSLQSEKVLSDVFC